MRTVGAFFLILALVSFLYGVFTDGPSLAETWAAIDANSLVGFQGFVDQRLDPDPGSPTLWFDRVLPFLGTGAYQMAAICLAVIGAVLLLVARARDRRRPDGGIV